VQYLFGALRVDAGARSLARGSARVHLTRKAFDLLLLLLESRPDAVSKERIFARLWPETFVEESSLQTLIHEIRQAIDDPGTPSWIRTVRGIGYCFDGSVLVSSQPPAVSPPNQPAAWLVGESTRVALRYGENTIGREGHDVIEIDAPTISRLHARILVGEVASIEDLGSKNGTWVQAERLHAVRTIRDGDVVRLGSVTFTFRLARPPQATESIDTPPGETEPTAS
jgi:DNA-binding winged helix-turn-helix (wHTH) protein